MGIEIKWDATREGLEIAFDVEGEIHRSELSWTRIEEMRQEMVRDIWSRVPKITEGVGSAFDEGRAHQREVDARLSEPGIYTKLAAEMRAEREAAEWTDADQDRFEVYGFERGLGL